MTFRQPSPIRPSSPRLNCLLIGGLGLLLALPPTCLADATPKPALQEFAELKTGKQTFTHVIVRQVGDTSVFIQHDGGLSSVPLKDLPPEILKKLGVDPAKLNSPQPAPRVKVLPSAETKPTKKATQLEKQLDDLFKHFGTPATLAKEVDLRPKFKDYGMFTKAQGQRASCAVFAITCLAEYELNDQGGQSVHLSEEFLLWATTKLFRRPVANPESPGENMPTWDMGYTFPEVTTALSGYGIALASEMPQAETNDPHKIPTPSANVLESAKTRKAFSAFRIPGPGQGTVVVNMVHALNAGIPVCISVGWPELIGNRVSVIDKQAPGQGQDHAIVLVGYSCPDGDPEHLLFHFRNSYSANWGAGGYGEISSAYLRRNMKDSIFLLPIAPKAKTAPVPME